MRVRSVLGPVDEEIPIENVRGRGRFGEYSLLRRFQEELELFLQTKRGGHVFVFSEVFTSVQTL